MESAETQHSDLRPLREVDHASREPIVSVCVITFNHREYIAEALESILMQEVEFGVEILIHDDASTDGTQEIIRSYSERYPNLIHTVIQKENQYSKGKLPNPAFNYPRARGDYIALLEGDDYWLDSRKLQRQVNALKSVSSCRISFHPSLEKWEHSAKGDRIVGWHGKERRIFTLEDVALGGGGFMPTASIVFHKEIIPCITRFFKDAPEAPIGDYYLQVLATAPGGALYLPWVNAVYRRGTAGSWSNTVKLSENRINWANGVLRATRKLKRHVPRSDMRAIERALRTQLIDKLRDHGIAQEDRRAILREHRESTSITTRMFGSIILSPPYEIFQRIMRRRVRREESSAL